MAADPKSGDKRDEVAEAKNDPLHELRKRHKRASEYWSDDRKAALDDLKFRGGAHWPADIVAQRERDKRPCLTIDKLNKYVRQIVNDGRQNRPSIKVRPVDSGADVATAEVFQGLIKHIEEQSNADVAYDTALDSAAGCGQGYFKIETDYVHDDTFDQEIYIRRVRNPLSILIDPEAREADASDMKYAFEDDEMSREDFEEKYPGKSTEALADDTEGWFGDNVKITRYWCVEEEPRNVYLLTNGQTVPEDEYQQLLTADPAVKDMVKETRDIPKRKVMVATVSGRDYLEEPKEWDGKYIPIVVVWGNELDIEGKVTHSGIIRPGKDPSRLYNYSRSAFAERVALTPKAPWVAAEGQVEAYEDEWRTANTDNHSVLRYTPTSLNGTPVPPPQRTSASDIPSGFAQDMQISEHDIQESIGMFNASIGAPSNERSGKAIMARQREGDVGTFHYHDNLNRGIRHAGRIIVDLIPKRYDSTRIARTLGYDGTPGEVQLDPTLPTASQKVGLKMVYNLTVGRYDVSISAGPSYNTLRVEAAESMSRAVEGNPQLMAVIGDLVFKNMDWPGAQEISERLKLTLPPNIVEAEQNKKQTNLPPEMQMAMAQFKQQVEQKDQMIQQAADHIEQLMAEMATLKEAHDVKMGELSVKERDSETKRFEAETARMLAETQANVQALQALTGGGEDAGQSAGGSSAADGGEGMGMGGISITVPVSVGGKGTPARTGRAVKQPDGSWAMEAVEVTTTHGRAMKQPDGSYVMEAMDEPVVTQ